MLQVVLFRFRDDTFALELRPPRGNVKEGCSRAEFDALRDVVRCELSVLLDTHISGDVRLHYIFRDFVVTVASDRTLRTFLNLAASLNVSKVLQVTIPEDETSKPVTTSQRGVKAVAPPVRDVSREGSSGLRNAFLALEQVEPAVVRSLSPQRQNPFQRREDTSFVPHPPTSKVVPLPPHDKRPTAALLWQGSRRGAVPLTSLVQMRSDVARVVGSSALQLAYRFNSADFLVDIEDDEDFSAMLKRQDRAGPDECLEIHATDATDTTALIRRKIVAGLPGAVSRRPASAGAMRKQAVDASLD